MEKYDENEVLNKLKYMEGWNLDNKKLSKEVKLKDFQSVIEAVNKIAAEAEKMDHHPDILIHSWNQVKIMLSTHSEGLITSRDFDLAERINRILQDT